MLPNVLILYLILLRTSCITECPSLPSSVEGTYNRCCNVKGVNIVSVHEQNLEHTHRTTGLLKLHTAARCSLCHTIAQEVADLCNVASRI